MNKEDRRRESRANALHDELSSITTSLSGAKQRAVSEHTFVAAALMLDFRLMVLIDALRAGGSEA